MMKKITDPDLLYRCAVLKSVALSSFTGVIVVALLMCGVVGCAYIIHFGVRLLILMGYTNIENAVQITDTAVLTMAIGGIMWFALHLIDTDIEHLKKFGNIVRPQLLLFSKQSTPIEQATTPAVQVQSKIG